MQKPLKTQKKLWAKKTIGKSFTRNNPYEFFLVPTITWAAHTDDGSIRNFSDEFIRKNFSFNKLAPKAKRRKR